MQGLKLTISQLNNYIKSIFDNEEMLFSVSVYGEVSGYKISGGNAYFEIKDSDAQLSVIEFGAKTEIKNGDSILVTGRLNYHVRLGKLSFVAQKIEPYGMGELYKKFIELKIKLEQEGLFSELTKKPIPKYNHCVGVVTSETGAVIHDIINVARAKNPYTEILIYPVKVQGIGAEKEISEGIKVLNQISKVDVIIVARGGGSMEDLTPFNTEEVARAVFESKKPVVSGVGHETDFTLCDFASDLRAPTPSVASDLCVFDYYQEIEYIKQQVNDSYKTLILLRNNEANKVSSAVSLLASTLTSNISIAKFNIQKNIYNITTTTDAILVSKGHLLDSLTTKIEKLNPMAILKNGYTKLNINDIPINSVKATQVGDLIENILPDGKIYSQITKIKEN